MATAVRPRTRLSDPIPGAARESALQYVSSTAEDMKHLFAFEDFVEVAVLQPDGESRTSQIFWVPDGLYDWLAMSTAVSYARESDMLDAVTVAYRSDGDTIHIAEWVRKVHGGQSELKDYSDFALLRIGGYTIVTSLSLWPPSGSTNLGGTGP